jgi:hypothetical protein
MAIDSNDQQVTSEMSRRFEHFNINDQERHDAYESPLIGNFWPSEPTYMSEFRFDLSGEPKFYISEPMDESTVFEPNLPIHDTTDIGSEGSSVYPGPTPKTSLNGMDWV